MFIYYTVLAREIKAVHATTHAEAAKQKKMRLPPSEVHHLHMQNSHIASLVPMSTTSCLIWNPLGSSDAEQSPLMSHAYGPRCAWNHDLEANKRNHVLHSLLSQIYLLVCPYGEDDKPANENIYIGTAWNSWHCMNHLQLKTELLAFQSDRDLHCCRYTCHRGTNLQLHGEFMGTIHVAAVLRAAGADNGVKWL